MGKIIKTSPPPEIDKKLQEKFAEEIAGQGNLLDNLSKQLITIELAIPGLYATVLKLVSGDTATIKLNPAFLISFGTWFLALLVTMFAIFPRKWKVNTYVMEIDPKHNSTEIGIADFFRKSAKYKRLMLFISSVLFFTGIVSAVFAIF
jgi:hypothetical protein